MNCTDVVAYLIEGQLYCPDHVDEADKDDDTGHCSPVFADSEGWQDHACFTCRTLAVEAGEQPETLGEANR